jgi:YesN/AraC family two-component response regulator
MRRIQPRCVNFILTGYPAFETALQAIRNQVDDYLVKPACIPELVTLLEHKLSSPRRVPQVLVRPLEEFLCDHATEIVNRALAAMKIHPRLSKIPLTDAERIDHISAMLIEIVRQLRSKQPDKPTEEVILAGVRHGQDRRKQGYSQEMLVDDTRVLDSAIYDTVQDRLLNIQLSNLIPDLSRLNDALDAHLQQSLQAFNADKAA